MRRWRHSRTVPGMSASDSDAAITIAASVGWGRLRNRPGASTSISTIAPAPTTPVSCDLAPACSATAVREPLVLTGKPWNSPAATFAAPMPIISPLPSTSCPVRSANADAVEIVSASATRTIPSAPATSSGKSDTVSGNVSGGKPDGSVPTSDTPCAPRSNRPDAAIATTTATRIAGTFGTSRLRTRITARLTTPIASAAPTVSPAETPSTNARASSIRLSASVEKPNSFGNWPIRIVIASPFM